MAYFAGNAIYIGITKFSTELSKLCAGVTLRGNSFSYNVGMKTHYGGAVAASCRFISSATHEDYGSDSGYMTAAGTTDYTNDPYFTFLS